MMVARTLSIASRLAALCMAGSAAAAASGQDIAPAASVEDFAVSQPAAKGPLIGMEQVATPHSGNAIEVQGQVATSGDRGPSTQIGGDQRRSTLAAPALSSRADGKPPAAFAVGGADRCDPQDPDAAAADMCRRIIEKRAEDFDRTRRADVSAEAALLAIANGADRAAEVGAMRTLRSADADDRIAQELAAVTYGTSPQQTPAAQQLPAPDNPVSEVVAQIITQIVVGAGGP